MNKGNSPSYSLHNVNSSTMKNTRNATSQESKKILVNPLIAGSNIHYNKGKYTIASSKFGVKESTGNVFPSRDKIHYNPKFLSQSYAAPKKENVHVNPNYFVASTGYAPSSVTYSAINAIYVNPNFISSVPSNSISSRNMYSNTQAVYSSSQAFYSSAPSLNSCVYQSSSKYKFVRRDGGVPASKPVVFASPKPQEPKTVSKYKLVYSTAPSVFLTDTIVKSPGIMIKSKYSIRTCQPNAVSTTSVSSCSRAFVSCESKKRIRHDFKRISRTKLVRRSVLLSKALRGHYTSFKSNPRRTSYSKSRKQLFKLNNKSKINRSRTLSENGIFKAFSSTKIIRKSVLRAQIDARKLLRKSLNSSVTNVFEVQPLIKSKYKLVLKCSTDTKKLVESGLSTKRSHNLSKVKKRKSLIAKLTSKLRKNNQRCLFYNRFGRCKGKDKGTCNKIHDPLYVSICKKLPFGECTDTTCLLSHDVRPGKMPTCYHYLAGICKRDNCPFLHIKVNPKAPICHSFLQGYCPDVSNCMKRHEYVCPVFADKGTCPKGKSCAHPHKIPTVHSKLLTNDQRPLMSKTPIPAIPRPLFVVSENGSSPLNPPAPARILSEPVKLPKEPSAFTRYFSIPLSSNACDVEEGTSDALNA